MYAYIGSLYDANLLFESADYHSQHFVKNVLQLKIAIWV